jgi:predicted RNase H-like nuclease (RuvC/YqgF family)
MSETQTAEPRNAEQLSYDTYRRAIGETKKYKKQLEDVQNQLNELLEVKKQAEQKELETTGKYKEMYDTLKAKFDAENKQVGDLKKELKEYKEIISKDIPDEIKETFEIDTLTIKQIEVLASKYKVETVPNSPGAETTKKQGDELDITKMNAEQIFELANKNPQAYFELIKKRT